jgi:membrane fusion protein, multidrug efflux system
LRKGPLLAAVLAAAALGGLKLWRDKAPDAPTAPAERRPVTVKGYKVRPRTLQGSLLRNGTVRPRAETSLQFGTSGRILSFDAEKGQFLRKGAVIARLDPAEAKGALESAEIDFKRASMKYFQDRTIDKLEFDRAKLRYNQARLDFDKTVLRAPHSGYLIEKSALAGEQAQAGAAVGRLMDKSRVTVELSLTERDIAFLEEGQSVEVTVDAVPDYRREGRVKSITPYLEGNARSFAVKVDLPDNPGEALSPGMFARCAIHRYRKERALTVPVEAALDAESGRARLFVVDASNTARERAATVAFAAERELEVDGVSEGEIVVLDPPLTLADGAKVSLAGVFDPASMGASPGPGSSDGAVGAGPDAGR